MRVKNIAAKIEKLRQLVAEWSEESSPAPIEREIAIDYVKEIYETLRFSTTEEMEEEVVLEEVLEEATDTEIEETDTEMEETDTEDRKEPRLKKLMSLYNDPTVPTVPTVPPDPTVPTVPTVPSPERQTSRVLLDTLSLNDRLLLSNELFDGDTAEMERLILVLGAISTLDDALIYIAQRYRWKGDNEGAKLLFSLLKNRYIQI